MKKRKKIGRYGRCSKNKKEGVSLYDAPIGCLCRIVSLPEESDLLEQLGIFPDQKIKKCRGYGRGGPVLLKVNRNDVAVGYQCAKEIMLEELPHV